MIEFILYSLIFIALLVASTTDLKTREVPDWLSYGLIFTGFGLRLLYSILLKDHTILVSGLAGFTAFLMFALMMYYTGQWGGGDSKLLMGVGAMIGLEFRLAPLPSLAVFLINTLLAGAVYGILWIIILGIKNRSRLSKEFMKVIYATASVRNLPFLLFLFVISVILAASAYLAGIRFKPAFFITVALLPLLFTALFVLVKAIENISFYKTIPTNKLTEGDWIARPITVRGKLIASPKDLGISKAQIRKLISLKIKTVPIKEGIPFIPSFLFGFLLTIAWGDWITPLMG